MVAGKPTPLRRWINVLLRGLHLAAVIALGASLLGAPIAANSASWAVLASGTAMFAIDLWSNRNLLREAAGISMIVKLGLVALMAFDSPYRLALFWLIVAGTTFFSHAPARFRHARLIGPAD